MFYSVHKAYGYSSETLSSGQNSLIASKGGVLGDNGVWMKDSVCHKSLIWTFSSFYSTHCGNICFTATCCFQRNQRLVMFSVEGTELTNAAPGFFYSKGKLYIKKFKHQETGPLLSHQEKIQFLI